MFGRLLKHEFGATARIIPFVFFVTIVMSLIQAAIGFLRIEALTALSMVITLLVGIAQIVVVYALVAWRYYKSMYANEGYLTHTLPLAGYKIFWSKVMVAVTWALISIILMVMVAGTSAVNIYRIETGEGIGAFWQEIEAMLAIIGFDALLGWPLVLVVVALLSTMLLPMAQIFFSISAGHAPKLQRLGLAAPILVYIGVYLATEIMELLSMLFIPLSLVIDMSGHVSLSTKMMFFSMHKMVFETAMIDPDLVDTLSIGIGSLIILPLLAVTLLFSSAYMVNKKTNLR